MTKILRAARPRIDEDAKALDCVDDFLTGTSTHSWKSEIVGYRVSRFLVGVTYSDGRKEVIIVGPRGGLETWIVADPEFAARLSAFLLPGDVTAEVKAALEGDSNDAEHDALATVAMHFGIHYEDPE